MGGENLSLHTPCRVLFRHWSLSRHNTTTVIPRNSWGSALSIPRQPTSTRPRPTAGQQRRKACTPQDPGSFHHPILYVTMVPRDDRPFPEHVATAASTAPDKTSLLSHHPGVSAFSWPYKREGRGLYEGRRHKAKTSHHPTTEDQHLKQSPLYSLFETWDRLHLSQLVTPTQALRCKEIQYPPLDVGPSFAWTRINPRVFSLHHHSE
jgi:hypothetical protein